MSVHGTFLPYRPRQSTSEVGGENGLNADKPQRPNLDPSATSAAKFAAMPIQPSFNHVVGCIFLPERTP